MKKGELIALNSAFGKLTLPEMKMDDLYLVLSAKADIGKEAEAIEEKAVTFQRETKPEGAGDFEISLADPQNREWWNKSQAMRMRLYEEESDLKIDPCIPRDVFAQMAKGISMNEAALLMRYLVRKEAR